MSDPNVLNMVWNRADADFFQRYPDRQTHIRRPWKLGMVTECEGEFCTLGSHEINRRRIVLWRMPLENVYQQKFPNGLLKIPFLAFADETIEDRDDILLPIVDEIMREAAL